MAKKTINIDHYPWIRMLADFTYYIRLNISETIEEHLEDMKKRVNSHAYDSYIMGRMTRMYHYNTMMGTPIPWLRIATYAFFGWLRTKHPGLLANTLLEKNE